jgi:hypothetical protein
MLVVSSPASQKKIKKSATLARSHFSLTDFVGFADAGVTAPPDANPAELLARHQAEVAKVTATAKKEFTALKTMLET